MCQEEVSLLIGLRRREKQDVSVLLDFAMRGVNKEVMSHI
jgi:hypothetical protein